jgi:hypothetical protein
MLSTVEDANRYLESVSQRQHILSEEWFRRMRNGHKR